MTSTTDFDTTTQQEVRKHPVRGAIWGFFLGLGVAIYLILFAVIAFGEWIPFGLCIAAGIALGILWAYVAPAKQPKEPPPRQFITTTTATTAASGASESPTAADETTSVDQLDAVLNELGVKPAAPLTDDVPPPTTPPLSPPPPPSTDG
jgi:hypothetical protein